MKKGMLIILGIVSVNCWAWSPYDTYETGELVAAMATYTKQEMIRYQPQMTENSLGGLSWLIRLTGGSRLNSFLYYNDTERLVKYEILLPFSESSLQYLVESSGISYRALLNSMGRPFRDNEELNLGIVYQDRYTNISCKIVLELFSMIMRTEYYVQYKN